MAHVQFDIDYAQFAHPSPPGAQSAADTDWRRAGECIQQASPDLELPELTSVFARAVQFILKTDSMLYGTVFLSFLWSAFVVSMSYVESRSYSGGVSSCQWWCTRVSVDASASTYTGFPLFLLLGFRVNEAYGRYMEAANIWTVELKMYVTQFLTQVGTAFRPGLFHDNDRERIFALTAALIETLKRELRDERDLGEARCMLSKSDAENILSADDMPDYCLWLLNAYVLKAAGKPAGEVPVPGPWYPMVMGLLQNISRCKERCCRIRQYRVVYGYVAHLHAFLGIWLAILPFTLVQNSGWLTILWAPMISYGVAGMEAVATELSDPFGYHYNDLRLGKLSRQLHEEIRECFHRVTDPTPANDRTPAIGKFSSNAKGISSGQ